MLQQPKRPRRVTRIGLGWAIHRGLVDEGKLHSHDALQISCTRESKLGVDSGKETVWAATILIHRGVRHAVLCPFETPTTLFLDPDSEVASELAAMAKGRSVVRLTGQIESSVKTFVQSLYGDDDRVQNLYERFASLFGTPQSERPFDARVQAALATLVEGHRRKWPLTGLAKAAGMSNSQFARLFRKCTGLPVRTHIRWLRFQTAIQSLAREDDLTAAALSAGYSDALQFKQAFRRVFGLSPAVFASARQLGAHMAQS